MLVKAIRAFQLIQGLIKPHMKWHAVMGNEAIELYNNSLSLYHEETESFFRHNVLYGRKGLIWFYTN